MTKKKLLGFSRNDKKKKKINYQAFHEMTDFYVYLCIIIYIPTDEFNFYWLTGLFFNIY